ncbi:hypothetical protein PybrP1_005697 [[Pythium] brassicae (nom. inval.)]|nr:hypothetical protein PybrP1_005697 [[Pythium] brassicae (nom. inval.)]
MNARGALQGGVERTPLLPNTTPPPHPPRESTRVDLRRVGAIGLVLFCLVTAVGLVRVIAVSNEVLEALRQLQVAPRASEPVPLPLFPVVNGSNETRVLVVYSDGPHLAQLAQAVEQGVRATSAELRVRTVANASFADDVRWADAVVLGSHVVNANVEPKMAAFMSTWALSEDLSRKVGAVFVTGGGISSGEELTMVNLLHSMLIFRMVIVGGERWTSAFGASAVVAEGPFQPRGSAGSDTEGALFPSLCYPSDPNAVHAMFKDKAVGLGQRVASIAALVRRHT